MHKSVTSVLCIFLNLKTVVVKVASLVSVFSHMIIYILLVHTNLKRQLVRDICK